MNRSTNSKIVLIGYRGVGKTTLGKALADTLKRPFIDTDDLIVQAAKRSIPEIFNHEGEPGFRLIEKRVIASINIPNAVIACGGGAILDSDNVRSLKNNGYLLWLTATSGTLLCRISNEANRPPLTLLPPLEEIETVLKQRTPLYAQYADRTLSTEGKSIQKLLDEIIKDL
ncbi:shikimate kinase [Waddlia chondrophila]|nr:shikimate kinase [Waddlia chondrophila]